MAVYKPCSGRAPDAIAKAIERGKATTPTTIPARILVIRLLRLKIRVKLASNKLIEVVLLIVGCPKKRVQIA